MIVRCKIEDFECELMELMEDDNFDINDPETQSLLTNDEVEFSFERVPDSINKDVKIQGMAGSSLFCKIPGLNSSGKSFIEFILDNYDDSFDITLSDKGLIACEVSEVNYNISNEWKFKTTFITDIAKV